MQLFAFLRTFSVEAVALRMVAALVCGSIIGCDREMRNKRAGLKTHAMVCLGAALCVIVSESINLGRTGVTGLWTTAIVGLACGAGWVEIALIAVALIMFIFIVMSRIDQTIGEISHGFDLYAELTNYDGVPDLLRVLHDNNVYFSGLQVGKSPVGDGVIVQLNGHTSRLGQKAGVLAAMRALDCVKYLEDF